MQQQIANKVATSINQFLFQQNLYDPFGILQFLFRIVLVFIRKFTKEQIKNILIILMIFLTILECFFNSLSLYTILGSENPFTSFCVYLLGFLIFMFPNKYGKHTVIIITLFVNLWLGNIPMAILNAIYLLVLLCARFIFAILIYEFVSFATTTVIDEIVDNREQILLLIQSANYQEILTQLQVIYQNARNTRVTNLLTDCKKVSISTERHLSILYHMLDMSKYRKYTYGILFILLFTYVFKYFYSFSWYIIFIFICMCIVHTYKNIIYMGLNAPERFILDIITKQYRNACDITDTINDTTKLIEFGTDLKTGIHERDTLNILHSSLGMYVHGNNIYNRYR